MNTLAKRIETMSRYYNYAKMVNDIALMKMCEYSLHELFKQEAVFLHEKMVHNIELEMHIEQDLKHVPELQTILTHNNIISMKDNDTKQVYL